VVVAGGANVYFARHFWFRPEANLRMVIDGSETYRVGTVAFSLVYHVEEHGAE
jgi:hypothetical protein